MKPLRILVVEDDAVMGMLLAELLVNMGHAVCGLAKTEAAAVATAARHRPDLMIVDMQLAEGTGVSAVEAIVRTGPIPHVFMSGRSLEPVNPDAVVLRKPFREPDLARAIARVLAAAATVAEEGKGA